MGLWLTSGYIDWAVPMNYTSNENAFNKNIKIIKDSIFRKIYMIE